MDRYLAIRAEYDQAMAGALTKNAPQSELRRIGETRQNAFRALIVAGLNEPDKMTASDWAAIASASEYLFQRDDCIKYSFRAIELKPTTKEAYVPLIRSLSNANRIDDAEAVLASAERQFNDGTKWHGMHHILFLKRSNQKQWTKAAAHLQIVLDTMLAKGGENAAETRRAVKILGEYLTVAQHADLDEQGRRQLEMWSRTCEAAVERISNDDAAGVDELQHCAALCEVQCEIAKCSPELDFDSSLLRWAGVLYNPRWAVYEKTCRLQQMYFEKYIESNAAKAKNWSKISAGFSQLLKDHFAVENEKQSDAQKAMLVRLQEFADSRVVIGPASEVRP